MQHAHRAVSHAARWQVCRSRKGYLRVAGPIRMHCTVHNFFRYIFRVGRRRNTPIFHRLSHSGMFLITEQQIPIHQPKPPAMRGLLSKSLKIVVISMLPHENNPLIQIINFGQIGTLRRSILTCIRWVWCNVHVGRRNLVNSGLKQIINIKRCSSYVVNLLVRQFCSLFPNKIPISFCKSITLENNTLATTSNLF